MPKRTGPEPASASMRSESSAGRDARTGCTGRRRPATRARSANSWRGPRAEGYRLAGGRAPFHGYYYKILTRQGPNAKGGAMDYIVRGRMIGGFALVAYPAEYDNSGVMTFIVNQDGVVYEKDLGPNTAGLAGNMSAFDPDQTWRKVANDGGAEGCQRPAAMKFMILLQLILATRD